MAVLVANQRFAALAPFEGIGFLGMEDPTIVRLATGGFVVTWEKSGGFYARIFDRHGAPTGSAFQLTSMVNGTNADNVDIVALPSGGFAATWQASTSQGPGIQIRLFDAGGAPLGPETFLNGVSDIRPGSAPLVGGGGVVVYLGDLPGSGSSVVAQRLDSSGAKLGSEIAVQTGIMQLVTPMVSGLADGGFVVAWTDFNVVRGQIFNASGQKVGERLDLAPHGSWMPTLETLAGGNFVLAYVVGNDLKAKIFSPAGAVVVAEFDVATSLSGTQYLPSIVPLETGEFLVTWRDATLATPFFEDGEIRGQLFSAGGARIGEEFLVNAVTTGGQDEPASAMFGSGDFAAAWLDYSGGTQSEAKVRLFFSTQFGTEVSEEIVGSSDRDFVFALGGNDVVTTGAAADELDGGGGDDLLNGGSGVDRFDGGGHDGLIDQIGSYADRISFFDPLATQGAVASLAAGTISNDGFGNAETMVNIESFGGGTAFADTFQGNNDNNALFGGRADNLYGLAGQDMIYLAAAAAVADGGTGIDILVLQSDAPWLLPDSNGDGIAELAPAMTSGWTVDLGAGTLRDGYGNVGAVANFETLVGSDLADELRGSAAANRIEGGSGNDFLLLQDGGDDVALGGEGNDVLYFGAGLSSGDVANGGAGRDSLVLQGNVTALLSDTHLVDIESISLQSGANTRFGDTANNFYDFNIKTADGNVAAGQQLIVNASSLRTGEDFTFDGSAEHDGKFLVYGGHGTDILKGGDGVDVFFFEGQRWTAGDRVDGGAGRDALVISAGSGLTHIEFAADSFANIESISVNNHFATDPSQKPSYELVLHNGNVAPGGTLIVNGSSIPLGQVVNIDGRAVHDGNLTLLGGGGHDVIYSGDGADLIIGGGGSDSLAGFGGADVFRYDSVSDSAPGLSDLIADFQPYGIDKIDLSRIDANTLVAGDQAFTFVGAAAFSGSAGELRFADSGGYRWVEGDTNGDGTADFSIAFYGNSAPQLQGDFLL